MDLLIANSCLNSAVVHLWIGDTLGVNKNSNSKVEGNTDVIVVILT